VKHDLPCVLQQRSGRSADRGLAARNVWVSSQLIHDAFLKQLFGKHL
jgi:hypothetical protein